jgi:hypothetical protein
MHVPVSLLVLSIIIFCETGSFFCSLEKRIDKQHTRKEKERKKYMFYDTIQYNTEEEKEREFMFGKKRRR